MKKLITIAGLALVAGLQTASVHAIPTLYFDNQTTDGVNYNATTGVMDISAFIIDTLDVTVPNYFGGTVNMSVSFVELDPLDTNPFATTGLFTGVAGNDLEITDNMGGILLTGDFLDPVKLVGANPFPGLFDGDSGRLTGTFIANGGSLAGTFGVGEVFALELNLTTTFSDTMFQSDFQGAVDGRVEAVPEPGILVLLSAGLLLIGSINFSKRGRR